MTGWLLVNSASKLFAHQALSPLRLVAAQAVDGSAKVILDVHKIFIICSHPVHKKSLQL